HPAPRRKPGHAHQTAVDYHAHALDREARLCDVRGQHDLPPARLARCDGGILRLLWQIAVERVDVDVGPDSIQQSLCASNLAGARQEDEYVAVVIAQGSAHGAGGELLDACLGGLVEVMRVDRIAAALACYDRRI